MKVQWAPEIEELVAEFLDGFPDSTWASSGTEVARAVLTFLAEAGWLLPPGWRIYQQWQDYNLVSGGAVRCHTLEEAQRWKARNAEKLPFHPPPNPTVTQVCTVLEMPDGMVLTSPWRDVPDE